MSTETKTWLIGQIKKSGVKLNFFRYSDYNGQWKRPKIIGSEEQLVMVKMLMAHDEITWMEWRALKVDCEPPTNQQTLEMLTNAAFDEIIKNDLAEMFK